MMTEPKDDERRREGEAEYAAATAEDVLQRFSIRAPERASDLQDVRTVRGWLGRILASMIADYQRRAIRRRQREIAMEQTVVEAEHIRQQHAAALL